MKVKQVGITGGIGSGKSTISKLFGFLGIPVFFADEEAKKLMVEDQELIGKIKATFGDEAYLGKELNRAYLAKLVFKNKAMLEQLNTIVHPALGKRYERWHEMQQDVPYTLKEAAILFEMGGAEAMDKIITVFAPEALRIKRVMERDGATEQAVRDRISKQMPDEEKVKRADFVIINDGQHSLIQQVLDIHKLLTK
jgi:dephospho-CoA kinase